MPQHTTSQILVVAPLELAVEPELKEIELRKLAEQRLRLDEPRAVSWRRIGASL